MFRNVLYYYIDRSNGANGSLCRVAGTWLWGGRVVNRLLIQKTCHTQGDRRISQESLESVVGLLIRIMCVNVHFSLFTFADEGLPRL